MLTDHVKAKQPTIYRCPQADGSVVVQDRRCAVTKLQESTRKSKKVDTRPTVRKPSPNHQAVELKAQSAQRKAARSTVKSTPKARNIQAIANWQTAVPANWRIHQSQQAHFDQWMLSRLDFKGPVDFREGVRLSFYQDTLSRLRQDSFAQALALYHQIRGDSSNQLIDSQFKSHPKYKVFNIKYKNNGRLYLTEFYIDDKFNDLYVVTVQAEASNWLTQMQMAQRIIKFL